MSYALWIPPLGPDGSDAQPSTQESFLDDATVVVEEYLQGYLGAEDKAAVENALSVAVHAASMMAMAGIVGDAFRVHIAGHANPIPGSPAGQMMTDTCTVTVQAVKVKE